MVLFRVWFRIQHFIKKCPGYYSAYGSVFSVLLKNVQGIIQSLIQDSAYYSKNVQVIIQRMVQYSAYYSKMSRVLFRVWFTIQCIIQKCLGYYSASGSIFRVLFETRPAASVSGFSVLFKIRPAATGSVFRVLFKIRPAATGSVFSVILKNVQGIIQRLVQDSRYYSKLSTVLFSVWLSIQGIIQNTTSSVWFRIQRIIKKYPGYYSASGSGFSVLFRVLFKIRPAYYSASGSGFRVLLKMSRVLFSVSFEIQRSIQKWPGYYSAYGTVFSVLLKNIQGIIQSLVHDSAYY